MTQKTEHDVVIVGAGHAGCEAALASARMGMDTLLITIDLDLVAFMPCNPSIGGPAKGIVVREIDALGGEMAKNTDKSYVQMRMLNTAKGPAVRALRAQTDNLVYPEEMRKTLDVQENLTLVEDTVNELIVEDETIKGVITESGQEYQAQAVVLTTGTSSRGEIIIGYMRYSSGPNNSKSSDKLSEDLLERGFVLDRFKTGTPPRVDKNTVDFSKAEKQPGDKEPSHFSHETPDSAYLEDQMSCWLTYTNETTHDIIKENSSLSPMFTGIIEGVGARYCPSIEDKVTRFPDRKRQQIFLEPESRRNDRIYVQGLSTSLPAEIQREILDTIPGLEEAEVIRDGYAIEYDVVLPYQLRSNLETKAVKNLFTAGQMNGTSGYEEAAGQGIIAGINAALAVQGKEPFVLRRDEAYIGVMIDDLVTKGITEPYRLLTSRAEYRLLLRHDNADYRLAAYGHELGLISDDRYEAFLEKKTQVDSEIKRLQSTFLKPTPKLNAKVIDKGAKELRDGVLAYNLIKRPEWTYEEVLEFTPSEFAFDKQVAEQIDIRAHYEGYINKELKNAEKFQRMEEKVIPENLDYRQVHNLALEAREKLERIRPETIGQASRMSGVNPSDITFLSIHIETGQYETSEAKI